LIRVLHRTILHAGGAARALLLYDVSGLFGQGNLEVSDFSFYAFNFGKGEDLDVRMSVDLDQFG